MLDVAVAGINRFASAPPVEQPAEQAVVVLPAAFLQEMFSRVQELADRVAVLEETVSAQSREIRELREVGVRCGEGEEAIKSRISAVQDLQPTITHLAERNAANEALIEDLRRQQEQDHERVLVEVAQDRQRLAALEGRPAQVEAPPAPGTKTAARIEKLKQILKERGGVSSFKALRRDLGLKPNQFTALVNKLDKRVFIVTVNHRARDEKLLRLRAFT